jgi:hypothetical protein
MWLFYARLVIFAITCTQECTSGGTVLLAMAPLLAAVALIYLPKLSMNINDVDGALLVVFILLLVSSCCITAALHLVRR